MTSYIVYILQARHSYSYQYKPHGLSFRLVRCRFSLRAPVDLLAEVPTVDASPFRFLDLPFELRRQIIRYAISIKRAKPKPTGRFRTGFEIEPHDFTISAAGLRCHCLTSFSLGSVNRQVRQEVLSIIFQNATVCLHVEIPRYGASSKVAASVPGILRALTVYPLLCDLAREVTVIIHAEPVYIPTLYVDGPFILLIVMYLCVFTPLAGLAGVAGWVHRTGPFRGKRDADLQVLVDTVVRGFRSRKHLKIVLCLDDLFLQDLKILLGLFKTPCGTITLEEWWTQWHYPVSRELVLANYEMHYKHFVRAAAEEAGHTWFLTVCPSSEEFEVDETDDCDVRGSKIIGKWRRVWLE